MLLQEGNFRGFVPTQRAVAAAEPGLSAGERLPGAGEERASPGPAPSSARAGAAVKEEAAL